MWLTARSILLVGTAGLALALALIGCGGESSDSTGPEAVTKSFVTSLNEGDGEKTCSLLTPGQRGQVEQLGSVIGSGGCPAVAGDLFRKYKNGKVLEVSTSTSTEQGVKTTKADVTLETPQGNEVLTLIKKKDADVWQVSPETSS